MSHFIRRCRQCNAVVVQCRCPSLEKEQQWVEQCEDCKKKEPKSGTKWAVEDGE